MRSFTSICYSSSYLPCLLTFWKNPRLVSPGSGSMCEISTQPRRSFFICSSREEADVTYTRNKPYLDYLDIPG